MSALINAGIFTAGFVLGAGAMLLYFQYSIYSKASNIEKQFQEIRDLKEAEIEGKEEKE